MVRAFIAAEISREARDALEAVVDGLKGQGVSGVRWVRPGGVHLTLKFLGEIDEDLVQVILDAMERVCHGTGPFTLNLANVGSFPNTNAPRVIWVGPGGELGPLGDLQQRIDQELHSRLGFPLETRPFTPHLTLGRLHDRTTVQDRQRFGQALAGEGLVARVSWQVAELQLIRSTLTPDGAVYHVLGTSHL